MTLTTEALSSYDSVSRREWLLTNGTGSFASGTVAGVPTRRYHALLTAALRPPVGRMTLLAHVHETVTIGGVAYDLHTGRYADGTLRPQGWRCITGFDDDPVPTWQYDFPGDLRIVKRVFLAPGRNTVYLSYTRVGGEDVTLTLEPLVVWKDYHHEMTIWNGFPVRQGFIPDGYEEQATPDAPTLRLLLPGGKWTRADWWNRNNFHEREAERGQDAIEQMYCPATVTVMLGAADGVTFVGTIEPGEPQPAKEVLADIVLRRDALRKTAGVAATDTAGCALLHAADRFLVRDPDCRTTVIAGFPWFADWGRDTFVALPGLFLATRRFPIAREILTAFAGFLSDGMIPNRFPDIGETPDYNTADGTLWFVHACGAYFAATADDTFRAELAPKIADIIAWHERGTRFGIRVDPVDGLLCAGADGVQLTWMDAKVGGYVVTPRRGKPVEINALFLRALRVAALFTGNGEYTAKADRAAMSFRRAFVRPDGDGLYDVIAPDGTPDPAIRPNQLFAVSLPDSPLSPDERKRVVDVVTRELLTPLGIRTLSPADPAYRARYEGDGYARDTAYHQGTAWPWLLGAYADARRVVYGAEDVTPLLAPLLAHLSDYGIGGVAEVYDGSDPQRPNGCPTQAWSVAEVLRLYLAGKTGKQTE